MGLTATNFLTLPDVKAWLKIRPTAEKSVTSLTRVGQVATATVAGHGFVDGDTVTIAGAGQAEYNGAFEITVLSANAFSFTIVGAPATPATGVITAVGANDGVASRIANRVADDLESWTGRVFLKRTAIVETWNGDGRRTRFLRRFPIVQITSLIVDDVVLAPADYAMDSDLGQVTLKTWLFGRGVANCSAIYDAGYEAAAMPARITGLGLDLCKYLHEQHTNNLLQAGSASAGPAGINIIPGLPRNLRDAVERLKDVRFG